MPQLTTNLSTWERRDFTEMLNILLADSDGIRSA